MRITIVAVGKKRTDHFDSAIAAYQKRLARWVRVEWQVFPATDKKTETAQLLKYVGQHTPQTVTLLLDERGEPWSTTDLAAQLSEWQNTAVKELVLLIGGAHGVEDNLRRAVTHCWSLSPLVFPHELVRVIVMEQLYRAYDSNVGGNYHHA